MNKEKLRDKFKKETGLDVSSGVVTYSTSYVEWLEKQLLLEETVINDNAVCPDKEECNLIMFTGDLDICTKCNETFDGK